jgi:hypothetical protein
MRRRDVVMMIVTLAMLAPAPGTAADDRLRVDVSPRISLAPAAVRIRAMVTPRAENRGLRIVADSGDYYRSSYITLDGADAAAVTETSFKNLPGGEYEISVALVDAEGRHTVERRLVTVASRNQDQ